MPSLKPSSSRSGWNTASTTPAGGFTCFDNRGRNLLSTDKFTWSQGRLVWLLARAARLADHDLLDVDPRELSRLAEAGAAFLVEHTLRTDGTCHFVVDRDGLVNSPVGIPLDA